MAVMAMGSVTMMTDSQADGGRQRNVARQAAQFKGIICRQPPLKAAAS